MARDRGPKRVKYCKGTTKYNFPSRWPPGLIELILEQYSTYGPSFVAKKAKRLGYGIGFGTITNWIYKHTDIRYNPPGGYNMQEAAGMLGITGVALQKYLNRHYPGQVKKKGHFNVIPLDLFDILQARYAPPPPGYIYIVAACELLGKRYDYLHIHVKRGWISSHKFGDRIYVKKSQIKYIQNYFKSKNTGAFPWSKINLMEAAA